ncbi:MAG: diguanylate cyclase [Methylophaga sp.]|nr:diguanylate cyclase [Methylophaga sp.]
MDVKLPQFDEPAIRALLEIISDGIWFWHADTGYVYRNPGWYKMLGYNPHSLENSVFTWESVIHPDDYHRVMLQFEKYLNGEIGKYESEYRCRTKSGDFLWIRDTGLIVEKSKDGSVTRMIGAHCNIDADKRLQELKSFELENLQQIIDSRTIELKRLNKKLAEKAKEAERNATTDHLTSLANRFNFEQQLTNEISRAQRFMEPLSLIIMDIDEFKGINDQYGHPTGDEALRTVGKVLRNNLRTIDLASRWGGDEFALLLPQTNLEMALTVAEKIRLAISAEMAHMNLNTSASFGVVALSRDDSQIEFIRRADNALYQSKNTGRNKVSSGN